MKLDYTPIPGGLGHRIWAQCGRTRVLAMVVHDWRRPTGRTCNAPGAVGFTLILPYLTLRVLFDRHRARRR